MADLSKILGGPWSPPVSPVPQAPEIQFAEAIRRAGLEVPEIILDGKIHRFRSTESKKFDRSGWYVGHADGIPCITFGCWKQDITQTVKADMGGKKWTPAEEMAHIARVAAAKKQRDAEIERDRSVAASTVETIWAGGVQASPEHPYLKRKGVEPHGARVTGDGRLMLPLFSPDGELSSLQYIDEAGGKLYHSGGQTGGMYWMLGTLDQPGVMYIAEGFATAATIHQVTNRPCIVAYSASNLVPVTGSLREQMPVQELVIVADNDESGIGQRYAEQASAKYGARMIVMPTKGDANDYAQAGNDLKDLLVPQRVEALANVVPISEFMSEGVGVSYVWQHILARGWLYAMTANPGSGKTSVSLYMAVMTALGKPLIGKKTMPCKVLFLCGENPQDVRLRMEVMLIEMGLSVDALHGRIYFTRRPFAIDDGLQLARFASEAVAHGPYDLMFIDTGPAHSNADDENDNRAMHALAIAMRELMAPLGMPCTIALMHPSKGATKESLLPRGGSAFVGSIDGCLCLWRESGETTTELFAHGQKFRGRHFDPMYFDLKPVNHPTALDNFGDPIGTVIATPGDKPEGDQESSAGLPKGLPEAIAMLEDAIEACGYNRAPENLPFVCAETWNDHEEKNGQHATPANRRQALSRARKKLKDNGIMREVQGGYQVTEHAMSTVFAGCFMGLKSYGNRSA